MSTYISSGVFGHYFVTCCFLVSTLYGLNFYYHGYDYGSQINVENTDQSVWDSFLLDASDSVMSVLSILNPFILIKLFIYSILYQDAYGAYQALDLFILRPIGWVALWMEAEFIINKVRGISG